MSNPPIVTLRAPGSRGTSSRVRTPSFLYPSLLVSFLVGCTSTVTGQGPSSSSGGSGSPSGTSDGTTANGGTDTSAGGDTSGGSSEYDALFGPPESATVTEDTIGGLWAGQTSYDDLRLKFTGSSITIALKCRTGTIGTKVAAQVSSASIRIVESQQVGNEYESCSIKVRPQSIPRCQSEYDSGCFVLAGTTLRFNDYAIFTAGSYGPSGNLTKLSD